MGAQNFHQARGSCFLRTDLFSPAVDENFLVLLVVYLNLQAPGGRFGHQLVQFLQGKFPVVRRHEDMFQSLHHIFETARGISLGGIGDFQGIRIGIEEMIGPANFFEILMKLEMIDSPDKLRHPAKLFPPFRRKFSGIAEGIYEIIRPQRDKLS